MLKGILGIIFTFVNYIEPIVLFAAALIYIVHFFLYDRFPNSRIPRISVSLLAISAALTVVIVANRFL